MSKPLAFDLLRHRAEEQLAGGHFKGALLEVDSRKLLHELQVHQVELELQNEELRQAQAESEAALEAYTRLYDHAPVGYFTLDRSGVICRLNIAGAELLWGERSRLVGKRFGRFVLERERPGFDSFLQEIFEGQRTRITCETALEVPGQPQRRSFVHLEAVADLAAETCSLVAVDITARREAEIALASSEARHRQAREEAERAHRAKAHFLAHTSQELLTPLARMSMLAQSLADNLEGNLNPRQADYAGMIAETCGQLRHLVDDVVDLAAMEAGELTVEKRTVPIPDLLQDIKRQYQEAARRKGLSFGLEIGADVPAAIATDPHRLQQILRSLLGNAVKFTAEGGITLRVRLLPHGNPGFGPKGGAPLVAFDVADTGIGMSPKVLRTLFDFVRAAPEPRLCAFGNTGLGLPVVRQIAERLGGGVGLASKAGEGSTFTVFLPAEA
ncbi:MAG: sensor histidine kinase [Actinomycetota bacterium]